VNSQVEKKFREFFSLDRETIARDFDRVILLKYRKLRLHPREVDGFLHWCNAMMRYCDGEGKHILDAGCGIGIPSLGFTASKHPPAKITSLDPSPGKIEVMRKIAGFMGAGENVVTPVHGDAMDTGFEKESFDAVFAKDMVSHVSDRDRFYSEVSRVLKPGGIFLITDENNALDVMGHAERERIWKKVEEGPLDQDSWMKRTYREERKRIIEMLRPDLSPEIIEELAVKSRGMWGDGLKSAIEDYKSNIDFVNDSDFPYRDPVSGQYMEYPLDPNQVVRDLKKYGFQAGILRPVFQTGSGVKKLAGGFIRLMHPISILFQPNFYLRAVKSS
jgi:ubiquinone/menaquinone biosynthesis C-methylase UbiE